MTQIDSTFSKFPGEITPENIEDVIAFHRETFGGFRMEDEGEGGDEGNKPDESAEEDKPDEDKPDEAGSEGEGDGEGDDSEKEDDPETELPEWAQKELKKTRGEAAKYRTRLREIEQKFENAKSQEEYDAALSELREENEKETRRLLIENVALRYKLPDELAARLKGATKEELEEDAKSLQKFAPQDDEDDDRELHGGLDPFDKDTEPSDPRELGRRARGVRKR